MIADRHQTESNGAARNPATGQFLPGNGGGPGNPHAKRIGELRSALLDAVTPDDLREIVGKLVAQAKAGDLGAAREVLQRVLGRPVESDLLERLEALEAGLAEARDGGAGWGGASSA